jgi:hypothetical protein
MRLAAHAESRLPITELDATLWPTSRAARAGMLQWRGTLTAWLKGDCINYKQNLALSRHFRTFKYRCRMFTRDRDPGSGSIQSQVLNPMCDLTVTFSAADATVALRGAADRSPQHAPSHSPLGSSAPCGGCLW